MNAYQAWINDWTTLLNHGKTIPLGGLPPCPPPTLRPENGQALILSPHPDDECIVGALPLRLLRQDGVRVVNVAITQGSRKDRQAARLDELRDACRHLGFEVLTTAPGGLEKIRPDGPSADPANWSQAVDRVATALRDFAPRILFVPHAGDWNGTHIGTHHLAIEALKKLGPKVSCWVVETEFWSELPSPNLLVECPPSHLADQVAALSFHVGEVQRNPYHLTLPAWMLDAVRRGAERVGGQGGTAPDFLFGTLYRRRRWHHGAFDDAGLKPLALPASQSPLALFPKDAQA